MQRHSGINERLHIFVEQLRALGQRGLCTPDRSGRLSRALLRAARQSEGAQRGRTTWSHSMLSRLCAFLLCCLPSMLAFVLIIMELKRLEQEAASHWEMACSVALFQL